MYDPDVRRQCSEYISPVHRHQRPFQCLNAARHLEAGRWYCGVHSPQIAKERRDRRAGLKRARELRRARLLLKPPLFDGMLYILKAMVHAHTANDPDALSWAMDRAKVLIEKAAE